MKSLSELSCSPAYMSSDLFYDGLNRKVILKKKEYFFYEEPYRLTGCLT